MCWGVYVHYGVMINGATSASALFYESRTHSVRLPLLFLVFFFVYSFTCLRTQREIFGIKTKAQKKKKLFIEQHAFVYSKTFRVLIDQAMARGKRILTTNTRQKEWSLFSPNFCRAKTKNKYTHTYICMCIWHTHSSSRKKRMIKSTEDLIRLPVIETIRIGRGQKVCTQKSKWLRWDLMKEKIK